jgi:hypothetical protein
VEILAMEKILFNVSIWEVGMLKMCFANFSTTRKLCNFSLVIFFAIFNNYQTINPIIMDPMFLIININKPTYGYPKHVIGQNIHEKY